jgi:CspA family cold shock protein
VTKQQQIVQRGQLYYLIYSVSTVLARGFGFLEQENGESVFCHFYAIAGGGFKSPKDGDNAEFDVVNGLKGLQAATAINQVGMRKIYRESDK